MSLSQPHFMWFQMQIGLTEEHVILFNHYLVKPAFEKKKKKENKPGKFRTKTEK